MLESRTALTVRGGDYPIPAEREKLARFVFYSQIAVISGIAFLADQYLPAIVQANKITAGILVWLVGNMVSGGLKNTGAFEIYKGTELVWSTHAEGRLPSYTDIVTAFAKVGVDVNAK